MKYGLIAQTLSHTFSAQIHRMIGGYDYDLLELSPHDLATFLKKRDFDGINVTIPYKETVIPYLDELDPLAASVGAVNTIIRYGDKLIGYNTDIGGMRAMMRRQNISCKNKKVLILGTGGTSKTARAVARELGASEIVTVSRHPIGCAISYDEASLRHRNASILINTTPCGMYPDLDGCPISLASFPALETVVDVVYHPLATRLVLAAKEMGIPATGGLYMLVAQAALACSLFTGQSVAQDTVEKTCAKLLESKENLVLIGMPGCGKSAVGAEVARGTGRELIDLDQLISQRAGKSIPDIFSAEGEDAFRTMEANIVREIAGRTGVVIATGGGCILRLDNLTRLRQNGRLFLLDRPLAELRPTADRPLADSREKLLLLHRQRMPLYRAAADCLIPTENSVVQTAREVIQRFHEVKRP